MEICDMCGDVVTPLIVLSCTHLACAACYSDIEHDLNKQCCICFRTLIDDWPIIHKHDLDIMPLSAHNLPYCSDEVILKYQKDVQIYTNYLNADIDYLNPPNKIELLNYVSDKTNKLNKYVMRLLDDIAIYNAQIDILAKINRLDLVHILLLPQINDDDVSEFINRSHRLYNNGLKWFIDNKLYMWRRRYIIVNDIDNSGKYIIKRVNSESLLIYESYIIYKCKAYIVDAIVSREYININTSTGKFIRINKKTDEIAEAYYPYKKTNEYMKYFLLVDKAEYTDLKTITINNQPVHDRISMFAFYTAFIIAAVLFITGLVGCIVNNDYKLANDDLSIQNCAIYNMTENTISLIYANISATIMVDVVYPRVNETMPCLVSNCALYAFTDCFMIDPIVLELYPLMYKVYWMICYFGIIFFIIIIIAYTFPYIIKYIREYTQDRIDSSIPFKN